METTDLIETKYSMIDCVAEMTCHIISSIADCQCLIFDSICAVTAGVPLYVHEILTLLFGRCGSEELLSIINSFGSNASKKLSGGWFPAKANSYVCFSSLSGCMYVKLRRVFCLGIYYGYILCVSHCSTVFVTGSEPPTVDFEVKCCLDACCCC